MLNLIRQSIFAATVVSLTGPAFGSHVLRPEHRRVLNAWLKLHPTLRLGTDEDCGCEDDIERIRTHSDDVGNSYNTFSNTNADLGTLGNHEGPTSTHDCTDYQDLARFGGRLAAFLLHEPDRLLTVREVATLLAVSTPVVYRLCERGELAHVRVSNAIRIRPQRVIEYLRSREL